MKNIIIEPTKDTPYVEFNINGKLVIAGTAKAENANEFFDPLLEWIDNFNSETIDLDLILQQRNFLNY